MGQAEGAPKNTKLIEVSGMGFNGLLPKLDFFMLAEYFFRMDARAQIKVPWRPTPLLSAVRFVLNWSKEALNDLPSSWAAYGPVKEVQKQLGTGKYRDQLLGTLSFLGMQVGGNPDGAHAAFKDYAVDAVTARVGVLSLSSQLVFLCHVLHCHGPSLCLAPLLLVSFCLSASQLLCIFQVCRHLYDAASGETY